MRSKSGLGIGMAVVLGLVTSAGCSGVSSGSGSGSTLACRQKADADTTNDCAAQPGRPRKLDCSGSTETDQAIAAGCVREKLGDSDVCCPTTISGTPPGGTTIGGPPSGTSVLCKQKPDSDTGGDCAAYAGKPRKLDCDAAQTSSALAAGCVRETPTGSDVCCPTSVLGVPSTTTTAVPQAIALVTLSGAAPGCSGDPFAAGSFSPPTPIRNGDTQGTGKAAVTCSVTSSGSTFFVSGKVALGDGSSFSINGSLRSTPPPGALSGTLSSSLGTFPRTGCTATYPTSGGIAAGRAWATLTCPPVAGAFPNTCTITSQVKFENCTQ